MCIDCDLILKIYFFKVSGIFVLLFCCLLVELYKGLIYFINDIIILLLSILREFVFFYVFYIF